MEITKIHELTPIKDLKPQLFCIGRLLGMDLYIDVRGKSARKYELAKELLDNWLEDLGDT